MFKIKFGEDVIFAGGELFVFRKTEKDRIDCWCRFKNDQGFVEATTLHFYQYEGEPSLFPITNDNILLVLNKIVARLNLYMRGITNCICDVQRSIEEYSIPSEEKILSEIDKITENIITDMGREIDDDEAELLEMLNSEEGIAKLRSEVEEKVQTQYKDTIAAEIDKMMNDLYEYAEKLKSEDRSNIIEQIKTEEGKQELRDEIEAAVRERYEGQDMSAEDYYKRFPERFFK